MKLFLRGDELGEVAQGLRRVERVLHDAHRLFRGVDELVLCLFHGGGVARIRLLRGGRCRGLERVELEACALDVLARAGGGAERAVQRRAPAREEAVLHAAVLREARVAELLFREGEALQRAGEGVVPCRGRRRREQLRAGVGRAGERVVEGLGLRGGAGGGRGGRGVGADEGGLGFGGGAGGGEELDALRDGAREVGKVLADVAGVVVALVAVLRRDGEELGVHLLERVDALLQGEVLWRELGLRGWGGCKGRRTRKREGQWTK